jgi:Na+-translocating ferredoxin:NAD+ oxidoreductase subunit B
MVILISIVVLGLIGLIFGIILAYSSKKFNVKIDPKIEEILNILPGLNCGSCGYPGCQGYAEAIVKNNCDIDLCKVGGIDTLKNISDKTDRKILNENNRESAIILCCGDKKNSPESAIYRGLESCRALSTLGSSHKSCKYGCLGLRDCERICPIGAIVFNQELGIPEVNREKCNACGKCVNECPKNLIKIISYKKEVYIMCCNHEKSLDVKNICSVGCISCGACEKSCPVNAITMKDNLPIIDYEKCTDCGICAIKCPTKTIKHFIKLK